MANEVIVTVKGNDKVLDLGLPLDVPVGALAESLLQVFNLPAPENGSMGLSCYRGKQYHQIPGEVTLAEAGIMYGEKLTLLVVKAELPVKAAAYLEAADGRKFPLGKSNTSIGRRSPSVVVDLDLTALDTRRLMSRFHAVVEQGNGQFFLIDESSNGTLVNGIRAVKKERVPLKPNDTVQFGGKDGVVLKFVQQS